MKKRYTINDLYDEEKMEKDGWMEYNFDLNQLMQDINFKLKDRKIKVDTVQAAGLIGKKWFKIVELEEEPK